jgi:hypothetical protein
MYMFGNYGLGCLSCKGFTRNECFVTHHIYESKCLLSITLAGPENEEHVGQPVFVKTVFSTLKVVTEE